MKNIFFLLMIGLISCQTNQSNSDSKSVKSDQPVVLSQPFTVEDDDWSFTGTENLMVVPENRNNPESRMISINFIHLLALNQSDLAPVVYLGAGPGEPFDIESFYDGKRAESWRFELERIIQNRDIILVNQRGNSNAPGLQISNFRYHWKNGTIEEPFSFKVQSENRKKGYEKAIAKHDSLGLDLRGYDIKHFVDDVHAVKSYLGFDKICLVGNSFGSQWGLAYIQQYPEHVERALFSVVEPLNNNYDDPSEMWKVLEKIEFYAQKDPAITNQLPEIGLINAYKAIIEKLEKEPQKVHLIIPSEDYNEEILLGPDDFRYNDIYPFSSSYADDIESWPKYITEIYNGDYRTLALASHGRKYNSSSAMINTLVNNSLGISEDREEKIINSEAYRWMGDINTHFTSTRAVCPAPKVDDAYRQHVKHNIPILIIQGDMDLNLPLANATFLMNYLENGHLITVKRGFHNSKRTIILNDSIVANKIFDFMDVDFNEVDFNKFKASLPTEYESMEFSFWGIGGESLFMKNTKE